MTIAAAQAGYSNTKRSVATPRAIEHAVFARVTASLAHADTRRREDFSGFAHALSENADLWRLLGEDVYRDENRLPLATRQGLAALAHFVDGHTQHLLRSADSAEALIEINRTIMAGLVTPQVAQ